MTYTFNPQIHSARSAVYQTLKDQILSNELIPGTSISEKEISIQFGVSRTPVRESFVKLSQEGLLDIYPQRGTVVSLIDLDLVEEALFMRKQLECAVIRLACNNFPAEQLAELQTNLLLQRKCVADQDYKKMFEYDEAFHKTIFKGCRKLNTWTVIQQINMHLNRARMLRLAVDHHWNELFTQHQQMVEAIQANKDDLAEKIMSEHLYLAILDQTLLKDKFPTYFK